MKFKQHKQRQPDPPFGSTRRVKKFALLPKKVRCADRQFSHRWVWFEHYVQEQRWTYTLYGLPDLTGWCDEIDIDSSYNYLYREEIVEDISV